jgi:hypothetical protein
MRGKNRRLATVVAIAVAALCGFLAAGMFAGAGQAWETTPPPSTAPPPTTAPRGEGCTPGYWKQPQHFDSWTPTGFTTGQTLESVFDVPDSLGMDNVTLVAALEGGGGPGLTGAARILFRAAVAALLNSAHPGVDYPLTTAQVIAAVNAALASGDRDTMLSLAGTLDTNNNLGCPLN